MSDQTHTLLSELNVSVDTAPYDLTFEETIDYLAARVSDYDVIVRSQAVKDIAVAMRRAVRLGRWVPPLIDHGGLVNEAHQIAGEVAARYVGVCRTIRDAAASHMPGREDDALEIPSMVDLNEFDRIHRAPVRTEWDVPDDSVVFGWVGRLDRKKRVEDFVRAAALVHERAPGSRFVVIGGPDAFMPEYADEIKSLAASLELCPFLTFLGDRPDVPRLLVALDVLVWVARDEGMPHVIAEAGAAALPVIATRDNGTLEQIEDGVSGVFVAHDDPADVAQAMLRVAGDAALRTRLGTALRSTVEQRFATSVVIEQWQRLFDEVVAENPRQRPPA